MRIMKQLTTMLVTLCLLFLPACGGSETPSTPPAVETEQAKVVAPPSQESAADTIASAPEFSEYKFTRAAYSLPMQGSMLKGPALEAAQDLEKAGWILLDPAGNILIAGKSVGDKRFIVRDNGSLDVVPLARKEFVSVDATGHDDEGDVTIDFTWRWVPNEVAQAFERGKIATRFEGDQKARATIYPAKDGTWKIMRIVEIEVEEPEATSS
jgi:hypothetical protein